MSLDPVASLAQPVTILSECEMTYGGMKTESEKIIMRTREHRGLQSLNQSVDAVNDASLGEVMTQIIVAGVLQYEGRFLLIEELVDGILCLNQPTGRLEPGETPQAGAVRETMEESETANLKILIGSSRIVA